MSLKNRVGFDASIGDVYSNLWIRHAPSDRTWAVHTGVVLHQSGLFQRFHDTDPAVINTRMITISNIDPEAIDKILQWMYTSVLRETFVLWSDLEELPPRSKDEMWKTPDGRWCIVDDATQTTAWADTKAEIPRDLLERIGVERPPVYRGVKEPLDPSETFSMLEPEQDDSNDYMTPPRKAPVGVGSDGVVTIKDDDDEQAAADDTSDLSEDAVADVWYTYGPKPAGQASTPLDEAGYWAPPHLGDPMHAREIAFLERFWVEDAKKRLIEAIHLYVGAERLAVHGLIGAVILPRFQDQFTRDFCIRHKHEAAEVARSVYQETAVGDSRLKSWVLGQVSIAGLEV